MIDASPSMLTDFHHWLLDAHSERAAFLVISFVENPDPKCAAVIARHLNEFDAAASGAWLTIQAEIVTSIASDPTQRRLLGVADSCPNCPPTSPCGQRKILTALASRGHVVIDHPLAAEALRDHAGGFHVAIGVPAERSGDYDLIIRPSAFRERCLAPLIADSFLEWIESFTPTTS